MAKTAISSALLTHFLKGKKFIFVYHDISDEHENHHSEFYSTRINDFYDQIVFLKEKFNFISLDKIVSSEVQSTKEVFASLVFDDGFYSVFKHAFPFLVKHHIPFTIFINKTAVTSNQLWSTNLIINAQNPAYLRNFFEKHLGKDPLLSFDDFCKNPFIKALKELKFDSGIKFDKTEDTDKLYCDSNDLKLMLKSGIVNLSSHSTNHYVASNCEENCIKNDILENQTFLKELTGEDDNHFAIPFGKKRHFSQKLVNFCATLGYKYIYTTNLNHFSNKDLKGSLTLVPRISIGTHSLGEILFMINRTILKRNKL